MNWVDIKYTQNSIKKDVENGSIIPKFSNNLTPDFDFSTTLILPKDVPHAKVGENHHLNGNCFAVFAKMGNTHKKALDVIMAPYYSSISMNLGSITLYVSSNYIEAYINGTANQDISIDVSIKKIF